MLEPKRELWGASGARQGASGTPRGGLWQLQGLSLERFGMFRAASGKLWGAFASSEGASPVEKLKKLDLLYLLSENKLFEVPEASK